MCHVFVCCRAGNNGISTHLQSAQVGKNSVIQICEAIIIIIITLPNVGNNVGKSTNLHNFWNDGNSLWCEENITGLR
jgi:hypothetical protein